MATVRILLVVYCLAAAVACGIWVAVNASAASAVSHEIQPLERALGSQQAEAGELLKKLRELESDQRHNRKDYSPAEAISASYKVQKAQESYDKAHALEVETASQLDGLRVHYKKTILVIVPVGAALLLHVILLVVFWPKRPVSLARD